MTQRIRLAGLALILGAALPAVLPTALPAQRNDDEWMANCDHTNSRRDRERFCEVRVSGYKARPGVMSVDAGANGAVEVLGWDKDSVEIHARIETYDRSEADAKDLAGRIKITSRGNDIGSEGLEDGSRSRWGTVSFVVMVPRKTDLTLDTENGPIEVNNVSGVLRITSQNGPLALSRVAGDVHVRSQNGPVSVRLDGVKWDGAGLDASTQNGPMDLGVPRDYNANLEFGTETGPMSVGFPVSVTLDGRLHKRITTTLGSGGPTIRAVTQNGPFTLSRSDRGAER